MNLEELNLPLTKEVKAKQYVWPKDWASLSLPAVPSAPCVYCFEDEQKNRLYIGKTIHPKTRFTQHIKSALEGGKAKEFLGQAKWVSIYEVANDLEAVLLEARLIRVYKPKYNAVQKDDKSLLYIRVSRDDFPRISSIRKTDVTPGADYFGPFTSAYQTGQVLALGRKIFRLCANPPKKDGKMRACFYYHLNQCSGACVGKVSKATYRQQVGYLKKFLNGRNVELLKRLKIEIGALAKEKNFEEAGVKKQIFLSVFRATQVNTKLAGFFQGPPEAELGIKSLERVLKSYGVNSALERIETYDMSTLSQKGTVGAMVVFFLGGAQKSEYRKFYVGNKAGGDPNLMASVLKRRFSHQEWDKPGLVVLDGGIPQLSVCQSEVPSDVGLCSLAKKEEILIIKTAKGFEQIKLPKRSYALRLLQRMRDEAHRFSNTYQKKVRGREQLQIK